MSKKTAAVVHLNGCDRCAWHMLSVNEWKDYKLVSHPLLKESTDADDVDKIDVIIFTGYATKGDHERIIALAGKAKQVVSYGTCPNSGGIFGLLNQKGGSVMPITETLQPDVRVLGCPPSPDDLPDLLSGEDARGEALCKSCSKTFEEGFFSEIPRVGTLDVGEKCFNNAGIPCSGVVSKNCAQRCIDFEAPCRGCVENSRKPSTSMMGFYGSLAYMIDVATEANWWTTDKLSDTTDDLTESLLDIVGTFFRFHLASAYKKSGIVPSTGNDYSDLMTGRPIEEAIQVAGTIYGSSGLSVALNLIEGYEKATGQEISPETKEIRQSLVENQKLWNELAQSPDYKKFSEITEGIRTIAGNEVYSNLFFGGFRTAIESIKHPFKSYKNNGGFEPQAVQVTAEDGISSVSYSTDENGIIREWSCEF